MARWPRKPVSPAMQWDDPLASGLMLYQVMNEGAGPNSLNLARNIRGTFGGNTSPPGPVWTGGHAGPELDFIGDTRYVGFPTDGLPTGSFDFTIAVAYRTTNLGNNNYFFHYGSGTGTNTMFAVGTDNATQLRMTHWSAGQNTVVSPSATDGQPHLAVWTFRSSNNEWIPYYDGRPQAAFYIGLAIPANPLMNVGALTGAASLPYFGQLSMVGFWNRVLSPQAIVRLSADPFLLARRQAFKTVVAFIPIGTVGSMAHTFDAPTLAGTGTATAPAPAVGSLAQTFGNFIIGGAGLAVPPPAIGALAATVEDFTLSGVGITTAPAAAAGAMAQTFGDFALAGAGYSASAEGVIFRRGPWTVKVGVRGMR